MLITIEPGESEALEYSHREHWEARVEVVENLEHIHSSLDFKCKFQTLFEYKYSIEQISVNHINMQYFVYNVTVPP